MEALCGPPSFRDVESHPLPGTRGHVVDAEVWTYNFGPDRLLQLLRFRNNHLADIRSDGYGFAGAPRDHCDPDDIAIGMSKYELLFRCGQPVSKTAASLLGPTFPDGRVQRQPNGVYAAVGGYRREVYRERWVYDFGPDRLPREVVLENGKVTDVEDGEGGFDAH